MKDGPVKTKCTVCEKVDSASVTESTFADEFSKLLHALLRANSVLHKFTLFVEHSIILGKSIDSSGIAGNVHSGYNVSLVSPLVQLHSVFPVDSDRSDRNYFAMRFQTRRFQIENDQAAHVGPAGDVNRLTPNQLSPPLLLSVEHLDKIRTFKASVVMQRLSYPPETGRE